MSVIWTDFFVLALIMNLKVNNSIRETAVRNSASVPIIGTLAQVRIA